MPDGSQNCGCLAWRGNRRCPNIPDRGGSTGDTVRLVTFRHSPTGDRDHVGALIDGDSAVVDLGISPGGPAFDSMLALIRAGDEALAAARPAAANPRADAVVAAEEIALRTPLPEPPQIRDCLCFEEHLKRAFEVLRKSRGDGSPGMFEIPEIWYRQPIYYKANRLTVVGHGEDVLWPGYAETMDYELEFGFFIGAGGRDIAKRDARAHIFGYSIFNDFSARDAQAREMPGGLGPGKGKDFDTGNVIGPCIVTADELDPYDCTMIARVNGEELVARAIRGASTGRSRTLSPMSRNPRPFTRASSSARGRWAAAAGWSSGATCRTATRSSSRSRVSASCATGS